MRKFTMLIALLLLTVGIAFGQSKQISGTVIDAESGEPVIGASIMVKGTTTGTITDVDGKFEVNITPDHKTLVVSYVGMKSIEVEGKNGMVIKLQTDATVLDETIVVAYGTASKTSFTGSAKVVKGEEIEKKSGTEVSKALAGEVAGVQVINTSGQPGTNASIRIRGIGSINASAAPLYVVDGIPYEGDISSIDPSDIASMSVLKDAAATSLFGSRGANGVIMITTKKGTSGSTGKIDIDIKYGVNTRLIPLYDVISSPEEYMELGWEGLKNYSLIQGATPATAERYANNTMFSANGIPTQYNMWAIPGPVLIDPATGRFYPDTERKYTPENWSDYMFHMGNKFEANLKLQGGAEKTTYFTSFGYLKEDGYYIGSNYNRITARSNISHQPKSWLKGQMNMNYAYSESNSPGQSNNANNGFQFVNMIPSIFPVFQRDADGNKMVDEKLGGWKYDYGMYEGYGRTYGAGINPAGALLLDKDRTQSHNLTASTMLEVSFTKDLKLTGNVGMQYVGANNSDLTNWYYGDAAGLGRISKTQSNYLALTANQILTYSKQFGDHNVEAFLGHESTIFQVSQMTGQKSNLARPDGLEWSNAVVYGYMESETAGYTLESYFGQAKYNYDEKYFLSVSLRGDGSSRFEKGNRWGLFGAIGGAWLISSEDFLSTSDVVKNLKLKASWGVLGNQELGEYYPTKSFYSISNLNNEIAYSWIRQGNPDLTWEKSNIFNAGVEFDITKYLSGEIEFFNKTTSNMLFSRSVRPSAGYTSIYVNDGRMSNQGVEVDLRVHAIKTNNIKLDIRLNGANYTNKLLELPKDAKGDELPYQSAGSYFWTKGSSIYDWYIREYAGVNPETGQSTWYQYSDKNGDGRPISNVVDYLYKNPDADLEKTTTTSYADAGLNYVGKKALPDFTGGFGFAFEAYGFTLDASLTYGIGGYGYDGVYASLMHNDNIGSANYHKDMRNRWTPDNINTDVPRLSNGADVRVNMMSTRFLTSNSYLNFNNIRLGYKFPKKMVEKIKFQNVELWASGENLFLISARKGYVPFTSITGSSDSSTYTPLSAIMCGLKVQF